MSTPSTDTIIDALRPVEDPELHRSIVDLGMVRDVIVDKSGTVGLTVVLTVAGCPLRNEITNRVNGALRALLRRLRAPVRHTVMPKGARFRSPSPVRRLAQSSCRRARVVSARAA
jgi:metal-sulfur cluster biosynthetic enzyme